MLHYINEMVMVLRHNRYANYEKENFGSLKTVEKYLVEGSEGPVGTGIKNTVKRSLQDFFFFFFRF